MNTAASMLAFAIMLATLVLHPPPTQTATNIVDHILVDCNPFDPTCPDPDPDSSPSDLASQLA